MIDEIPQDFNISNFKTKYYFSQEPFKSVAFYVPSFPLAALSHHTVRKLKN